MFVPNLISEIQSKVSHFIFLFYFYYPLLYISFTLLDNDGHTPLNLIAYIGNSNIVELLISRGANLNYANLQGCTPISRASERGHLDILRKLINEGGDITIVDNTESSPLHKAAEKGHVEVMKLLITHGANIDQQVMTIFFSFLFLLLL